MAEKKFVVTDIKEDKVILESEGRVVKVPMEEIRLEVERLKKEGVEAPDLKVGLEISVGGRCEYHWKQDDCIAAYMNNLKV